MRTPCLPAVLAFTVAFATAGAHASDPLKPAAVPMLLLSGSDAVAAPRIPDAAATAAELAAMHAARPSPQVDLAQRLRRWQTAGPVYLWNDAAVKALVAQHKGNAPSSRVLALLHAALLDVTVTVASARAANPRKPPAAQDPSLAIPGVPMPESSYPSETAAIGAAAVTILSALLPAESRAFADLAEEGSRLRRQAALEFPSDASAGEAIGKSIAAVALARARDDGSDRPWTGSIPTGPGRWIGTRPAEPGVAAWRAWALPSNDALRPSPPPTVGSPELAAALAEVKAYKRTPKASADAVYWNVFGGARNFQLWHWELSRRALEHRLAENPMRAAAAFAALSIAYHDSHVACWDAKYAYWFIRPSQLDADIKTIVTVPEHPGYPSAHSCLSSAGAAVLEALFPAEAASFREMSHQAGEARIAAGLHFRFDCDAGDLIGRRAAALALERLAPALRER